MSYASNTQVSEDKSRQEIERLLLKYGADEFGYLTRRNEALIGFKYRGVQFQISIPLPDRDAEEYTHTPSRNKPRSDDQAHKAWAAEVRRRWRSLCLAVKAKLVAVEDGVATFETEFMPYMVAEDGRTVAEHIMPRIEHAMDQNKPLRLEAK